MAQLKEELKVNTKRISKRKKKRSEYQNKDIGLKNRRRKKQPQKTEKQLYLEIKKKVIRSQNRKFRKKLLKMHNSIIPENQKITKEKWELIRIHWGNKCAYCQEKESTTIDHVIPLKDGGINTLENVLPSCLECNVNKKRDKSLIDFMNAEPIYDMHESGFVFITDLYVFDDELPLDDDDEKVKK